MLYILLLGALLANSGCGSRDASSELKKSRNEQLRAVQTAFASEEPVQRSILVNGLLAAEEQAVLSVKAPGRVREVFIDLGSSVKAGDPVAQIEKRDYELRLQQARAAVSQARARVGLPLEGDDDTLELEQVSIVREAKALLEEATKNRNRIQELNRQGILSQSELESAVAAFLVAVNRSDEALHDARNRLAILSQRRAELAIILQELEDTTIRAPFDGMVQDRKANLGEYLAAGAPVATLVRMDPIRLRVEIPEREAPQVKVGQSILLHIEGIQGPPRRGKLVRLAPAVSQESRVVLAEASFKNDGSLRPGTFAQGEIVVKEADTTLLIPRSAVLVFAGVERVFFVSNNIAMEQRITTGSSFGDKVEVVRGLKPATEVILQPGNLRSGEAVAAPRGAGDT
ncbi:MAG: efflux RND transporter periplasmic adaptor subunit [Verrucomicrobiota bacterium]|nr:efflux RND transporter periplasmic adaptor subunit [Verrucomicrobiota bacterium]